MWFLKVWSKEGFTHLALPYDLVKTKRFGFKPTTKAKVFFLCFREKKNEF